MFPDRQSRSFLDHRRPVATGGVPAVRAAADAGDRLGAASQPAPGVERRVRRVPQVRPRRRPAAARLAGLRPVGPVLRQGVRGRHEPALLPRARHQRLDGLRLGAASPRSSTPGGSPATLGYLALQQGDAVGLSCVAGGIVRNIPPRRNPAHLMAVFDVLEQARPHGRDPARAGAARAGRDDPAAGPDRHPLGPVRRARRAARAASSTCGSASTTWPCFTCSTRRSWRFDFRRPMRFLDMEGGPSIFAEPNEIAERYHKALGGYLDALAAGRARIGGRLSPGRDRRGLRAGADAVPGRTDAVEGACDELPAAACCWRRCRWSPCRSSST